MTSKSLFQLTIQLCGFYFIFQSILQLIKTLTLIFAPDYHQLFELSTKEYVFSQIVVLAIYMLSGFALLFLARSIANYFSHKEDKELIHLKKQDIIEVFLIGLGIVMIVSVIPNIYPVVVSMGSDMDSNILTNTGIIIALNGLIIWKARSISEYIMKINAVSKKENS